MTKQDIAILIIRALGLYLFVSILSYIGIGVAGVESIFSSVSPYSRYSSMNPAGYSPPQIIETFLGIISSLVLGSFLWLGAVPLSRRMIGSNVAIRPIAPTTATEGYIYLLIGLLLLEKTVTEGSTAAYLCLRLSSGVSTASGAIAEDYNSQMLRWVVSATLKCAFGVILLRRGASIIRSQSTTAATASPILEQAPEAAGPAPFAQ